MTDSRDFSDPAGTERFPEPSAGTAGSGSRLRADAARNRDLILRTARRCFAERGVAVSLNEIAHAAGVGVATVYRRFPDKDVLIDALLAETFDALNDTAARAAAERDPREALRMCLWGMFTFRAEDRALVDAFVRAGAGHPSVMRRRELLEQQLAAVLQRATDAGVVRSGVTYLDLPLLATMVGEVADVSRRVDADAWRRYADVLLESIMPTTVPGRMIGAPLDRESMETALRPRL